MKYVVVKNGVRISKQVEDNVIKKLSRLEKMLTGSEDLECRVVVKSHGVKEKVEITIPTKFLVLRSEVEADDILDAVDIAKEKLESQIRKVKTKLDRTNSKTNLGKAFVLNEILSDEEDQEEIFVRTKTLRPTPMTLDDAIMSMDALGHNFFIYLDQEDQSVSVVYKRNDGGYGVIEIEE